MAANRSEEEYVMESATTLEIPNVSVGQYLSETIGHIITHNPPHLALIDPISDDRITYEDLNRSANELAVGLLKQQIQQDNRVMFFAENGCQYFELLLACWYLGVTTIPSKPANGPYELYHQLNDSQACILCVSKNKLAIVDQIVSNKSYRSVMTLLKLLIILDQPDDDEEEQAVTFKLLEAPHQSVITWHHLKRLGRGQHLERIPHFEVNAKDDYFTIVYTSGTSGLPKGVIHTHQSYLASILQLSSTQMLSKHQRFIFNTILPFGHISGTVYVGLSIVNQLTSVVHNQCHMNHEDLMASVAKYGVQMMTLFPESAADLYNRCDYYHSKYDLSSLAVIIVSGTKFPSEITVGLKEKYHVKMYEVYGSSEFTASVAYHSNCGDVYEPQNLGSPLPNVQMKVVNVETRRPLQPYQQGEVCFRGPACFRGYLNNQLATAQTLDSFGWYRSGDLGYYNHKAQLFITDRIKELIKYKHWSIAPAEIERLVESHPSVCCACVVGVAHAFEGQHLRAYVQLETECTPSDWSSIQQEIVLLVERNMGHHKRLNAGVQFIDKMPRTIIGKVDRQYFKRLVQDELLTELSNYCSSSVASLQQKV